MSPQPSPSPSQPINVTKFKSHHPRLLFPLIILVVAAGLYIRRYNVVAAASPAAAWRPPAPAPAPASAAQMASDVIAIKEGADLDLTCPIVVQNEDMIISWTCDNEPANIKSSRIHVTESGKLRIRSAKVGDSCNYRCEAADGFGTLSMLIKVIIVDKNLMEKLNRNKSTVAAAAAAASSSTNHTQAAPPGNSNNQQAPARQRTPAALPPAGPFRMSTLASPSTVAGASANEKTTSEQTSNHLRHHRLGSISAKLAAEPSASSGGVSQAQNLADDLQVQVDPMYTYVQLNKAFSLECQVKYGVQRVPQIIWLKEFIGPEPGTLSEAHDQNLILIDNVYYHSLNWPRSLSYSKETSIANSALVIRQAKPVHSGRYICLAGYQPTFMLNSASLVSSKANHDDQRPNLATSTSGGADGTASKAAPLKYKMDMTIVEVEGYNRPSRGDGGGDSRKAPDQHEQQPQSGTTTGGVKRPSGNLLISIFSENSWTRNLTLLIMLLIGLLVLVKLFVYPHYKLSRTTTTTGAGNNNNNKLSGFAPPPQLRAQHKQQETTAMTVIKSARPSDGNSLASPPPPPPPPKLPPKQLPTLNKERVDDADETTNNDNNKHQTSSAGDKHNGNDVGGDYDEDNNHLYSEIFAPMQSEAPPPISPTDATSSENNSNIYKVPNKLN